ncbi:MAG: hypothetical protein IJX89_01310 [Alphaproteobacteria bacterium]|nr:hypothetical protein [Alphaproteobacteria bacterium]
MKKLTAGIFTVLLGAVSVNAADAAVASKGYVDGKVGANTTLITDLTKTVSDNRSAADATATALTEYKTSNDAAVALKANAADVYTIEQADLKFQTLEKAATDAKTAQTYTDSKVQELADTLGGTGEDGESTGLVSTVTALGNRVSANETAISTLNGGTDTAGSVAYSIANALTDYAKTSYVDAQDATTLQSAKDYADGLADNYDTAGAATQALADAKAYTDTLANGAVKTNTDAIAAINNADTGILKQANEYTDDEIAKINTEIEAVSGGLSAYAKSDDVAATYATKTSLETTNTNLSTLEGTVTNAETGLAATRTLAQKGVDDAATAQAAAEAAQSTANSAKTTAEAAIPAPTDDCEKPENKCVLTYNNSVYTWEVIERGTDE